MSNACLAAMIATSITAAPAAAQAQRPDETFASFLQALSNRQWESAASYLDTKALLARRDSILRSRSEARAPREITIDDLLRADPAMPRVVAEYQLTKLQRHQSERPTSLILEFPDVRTFEEFESLAPRELAIEWLQGQDLRERHRAQLRIMGCSETADSLMAVLPLKAQVFGWVPVGDSAAFVVFADPFYSDDEGSGFGPLVAHLTRRGRAWRIVPRYDLFAKGNAWSMFTECPAREGPS